MLVQVNSSSSCRGWEENTSYLVETDHPTLRDYIIEEMMMKESGMTREESIKALDDVTIDFGWDIVEEDEISYEGEEVCTTYTIFRPTQKYVDMLLRNM